MIHKIHVMNFLSMKYTVLISLEKANYGTRLHVHAWFSLRMSGIEFVWCSYEYVRT